MLVGLAGEEALAQKKVYSQYTVLLPLFRKETVLFLKVILYTIMLKDFKTILLMFKYLPGEELPDDPSILKVYCKFNSLQ